VISSTDTTLCRCCYNRKDLGVAAKYFWKLRTFVPTVNRYCCFWVEDTTDSQKSVNVEFPQTGENRRSAVAKFDWLLVTAARSSAPIGLMSTTDFFDLTLAQVV
jgi:hypothetical protein